MDDTIKARWGGETTLAICFLDLLTISHEKEASVADLLKFTNGVLHWDVNFIRAMQDWELESLSNFMDTIYGASVRGSGEDKKMCWAPDKQRGFQVSGFYWVLLHTSVQSFPWKSIWKPKSRVLHLREGDANIRFFLRMANSNRRNNGIESPMVDGSLSSDQGLIVDCITQFFMNLYSEQQVDQPFPEVSVFPMISSGNADWFDRPFEDAKIFDVI